MAVDVKMLEVVKVYTHRVRDIAIHFIHSCSGCSKRLHCIMCDDNIFVRKMKRSRFHHRKNGGSPDSACRLPRELVWKAPVTSQSPVLWTGSRMDNLCFTMEP
jgi:hypothetical protein